MKTCGEASRFRKVVCMDENKRVQSSSYCDASKRPPEVESCGLPPCEYIWITGEWSEVSPHPCPRAGTAPLSTGPCSPPPPPLAAGLSEILQPEPAVAGQRCLLPLLFCHLFLCAISLPERKQQGCGRRPGY